MSFEGLLNKTCNIQALTETQNSTSGQKVKAWANLHTGVKCRLDQNTGSEFSAPDSIKSKATHILFLKIHNLTAKASRINIGVNNYNILSVQDGGGHGHHLELLLEKIG